MINPGKLNKVAKLLKRSFDELTPNGFISNDSWVVVKTIRCSIQSETNQSKRTVYQDSGVYNIDYKIITCRFFEDINPQDKILLNNIQYDIEFINNINEESKIMEIYIKRAE